MFCPKCKSILIVKSEKGKRFFACSCGYKAAPDVGASLKDTMKKDETNMDVVNEDDETLPITQAECPKCANKEAYFWLIQTRASDEPETKFHKCTKCKHRWRDYS